MGMSTYKVSFRYLSAPFFHGLVKLNTIFIYNAKRLQRMYNLIAF